MNNDIISFINTLNNHHLILQPQDAEVVVDALRIVKQINAPIYGAIDITNVEMHVNFTLGTCLMHKSPALYNQLAVPHTDINERFHFHGVTLKMQNQIFNTAIGNMAHSQHHECFFGFGIMKWLYATTDVICISDHNIVEVYENEFVGNANANDQIF